VVRREFKKSLAYGRVYEVAVAEWLARDKGGLVLPAYDFRGGRGGRRGDVEDVAGPPLFVGASRDMTIPDLLCFGWLEKQLWVEVKRKEKAVNYRILNELRTGLDLDKLYGYERVAKASGIPVYVVFVHDDMCDVRGKELSWLLASGVQDVLPSDGDRNGIDARKTVRMWRYHELDVVAQKSEIDVYV